jgi:predicted HD phosphohydrolase
MATVRFTRMDQMKLEDRAIITPALEKYRRETQSQIPGTVLTMLSEQRGTTLGYQIDRLQHSLQTATRAFREGATEEMVAVALLHDIGDGIGLFNHSEFATALLRPFISERSAWIVQHHGIFQGYFYFEYSGRDRNERDRFRGHPYFQECLDFCDRWDQVSFDPDYDTMPLQSFEPIVHRLFANVRQTFD